MARIKHVASAPFSLQFSYKEIQQTVHYLIDLVAIPAIASACGGVIRLLDYFFVFVFNNFKDKTISKAK